jgi:predicted phosphoribosyltransferase
MSIFRDRRHAGQALASALERRAGDDVVVLALPRGGVPIAFEVASRLGAPLDVFVVRKLGVPGHEELAMGAIASGGVQVLSDDLIARLGIGKEAIARVAARERSELARRERTYRGDRPPLDVAGRVVILIDDGLATGATMKAAVAGLRQLGPKQIVVAVPVAAPESCAEVGELVDEIVCLVTPSPFWGVGNWYDDFSQTTDEEVRALLGPMAVAHQYGAVGGGRL